MEYLAWEMWLINLYNTAVLLRLNVNERDIAEWQADFESGISPNEALKKIQATQP